MPRDKSSTVAFATATVGASVAVEPVASTFDALEHELLTRATRPASRTANAGRMSFRWGIVTYDCSGLRSRVSPTKSPATGTPGRSFAPWPVALRLLAEARRQSRAEWKSLRGSRRTADRRLEPS